MEHPLFTRREARRADGLLARLGAALLDLAWPPSCVGCAGAVGGDEALPLLCEACRAGLELHPVEPQCPVCGAVDVPLLDGLGGRCLACRGARPPWRVLSAAGPFHGVLRDLICTLKYRGETAAARPLARLLARGEAVRLALRPGWRPDCVVPVPSSRRRLAERGFNQAALIAAELEGERLDHLLVRADGEPQVGRRAVERRRLAAGTFTARPGFLGRSVLLVDDVVTTGATLRAAARTLRAAGARRIRALVLARTP